MNNENAFIIATSSGEGISELFLELGADAVMPSVNAAEISSDDFLAAVLKSNSSRVLLLPNDKEAYRAAKSITDLCGVTGVSVLPTLSFAEGYAALAAMPRGVGFSELYESALGAISTVSSINIVCEAKNGFCGRYSATSGGNICSLAASAEAALLESIERIFISDRHRIITLIVGKGVTNARRVFVTERLGELYPDSQIIVYIGGQTASEYYVALR